MTTFDEFWAAYPRRVAKKDAMKAWAQLRPTTALAEAMLAALTWQCEQESWTKDGGAYVPYPATWLRGERWTDEPLAAVVPTVPRTPAEVRNLDMLRRWGRR
jgi:hypothetical protein